MSVGGRILRFVSEAASDDLRSFLTSRIGAKLVAEERVVSSRVLSSEEGALASRETALPAAFVVEHDRVPFPSYPYEWSAEMVYEAGRLTLDIAELLLPEAMGLKDATPYNILFRGPQAVFVDILSFERRDPRDATWLPYAQFVRTFVLPLLANKHFGIPLSQVFLACREGLEPEDIYRLCGVFRRLLPPFLTLASLPTWLGSSRRDEDPRVYASKRTKTPEQATFILRHVLSHLRRLLNAAAPRASARSTWSGYATEEARAVDQLHPKLTFVQTALHEFRPSAVLDLGCNTGYASALAARAGARVVAVDYDPISVGQAWRRATAERLDVLPLVMNLARPSPSIGWRNGECLAFLQRVVGQFDAVLMLALIHHMLVTERIPLEEIIHFAADVTTNLAVIEYVPPDDPLFRRLTRGRESLFQGLSPDMFEATCRTRFEILRSGPVGATTRRLYLLQRKGSRVASTS
jgi:SAM-dependent methyltransferase